MFMDIKKNRMQKTLKKGVDTSPENVIIPDVAQRERGDELEKPLKNMAYRDLKLDKFTGEPTEAKKYEDEAMKIAVSASDVMFDAGAKSNE